jgi:hypothetical protein
MRGALAGALAAAAWRACDPALKRIFGTPYADAELIGPLLTRGPLEPVACIATHMAAGAAFGAVFERAGGRGARQGLAAAVTENVLLWPGLAVFDRIHPYVRDGSWPRLATNPRVFAQALTGHAVFGVLLGLGLRR